MPPITLKVFISSPGDVGQERLLATRVLDRLQGEFAGVVKLQPILWEHEPLRATGHFQEQIIPPSQTDIVICILWSRLGTRLPEQFRREDGTGYSSGTEWEFEDAVRSYRERGKPHMLVYRKLAEPLIGLNDHNAILERIAQKQALDAFIDRWFGNPTDSFKAAFHGFHSPDDFEELLETHLRKLIRDCLPEHVTEEGDAAGPIHWHKGSPFRGLSAFDVEHAPIFFGRTHAVGEIKNALLRQAANGCAFVVVFGMSGGGKSSVVRAGVLPTLAQPGVIEGIGLWRWCIFRPSDAAGNLFDGLALAVLGEHGLPELEADGLDAGELAGLFREAPQRAIAPIRMGLKRAAERAAAVERLRQPPQPRLAVVVDQMEELFTREGVDDSEREGFVAVLSALARSGLVWVIATMRSDFYSRCGEIPELVALKEGAGQFDLLPPTFAEIGQMIRHPARAAGVRFEIDRHTGDRLDEVLHEAAAGSPEALPLLEFTLDELFQQRTEAGVLTFAAYRELGGLEGALARRAEEVLTSLEPSVQSALPSLLRAIVTVSQGAGELVASRRTPVANLATSHPCRVLLDAFVQARLLVMDRADDGQVVVGVAHEALLRHWPRVQKWLEEDRDFLRIRQRIAVAAAQWQEEDRRPDFLLMPGKPLAEAEDLLAQRPDDLDAGLVEFIQASRRSAARARRRKTTGMAAVMAGVLIFGLFSFVQWKQVEKAREGTVEAIASLTDVPQKLRGVDKEVGVSILGSFYQASLATLQQMPDIDSTRRAKAVSLLLRAEMQRRQGQPEQALATCNEAVTLGARLVKDRPSVQDLRNLAAYGVTKGNILEDLGRYDEALAAYEQSRKSAEQARGKGSVEAGRDLWYSLMRIGSVQVLLTQNEEALAAFAKGLPLAEERAKDPKDTRARSELAYSYEQIGDALDVQGDSEAEQGKRAEARNSWSNALKNLQKSEQLLQVLARHDKDPQALKYLPAIRTRVAAVQRKVSRP